MTYEELMALALEHYNKGGNGVYECWDRQTFNEYVEMFGEITLTDALGMFRTWSGVCADRMED